MKIKFDNSCVHVCPDNEVEVFELGKLRQKLGLGILCTKGSPKGKKEKVQYLSFNRDDLEHIFMMQLMHADIPEFG